MSGQGIIFDMDGVLINSYEAHKRALQQLGHDHGLEVSDEMFAQGFGRTTREIIRQWWGPSVSDEQAARWCQEKEENYRRMIHDPFPAMEGVSDLIAGLHAAGFKLAVGSSSAPENVEQVLQLLENAHLFDAVVHGMEVRQGKPHPEVFLLAARKLSLLPFRCLVIEDAPAGVQAARRAGMAVVAITGTASREELAGCDMVIDSFKEVTVPTIAQLLDQHIKSTL